MNNLMKTMLDTVKQSGLVVFSHDVDSKPSVLTRSFMNVLLHASDMRITQLYKESQELFSSHGNSKVDISLLTQPEHQKRKLREIFRPDPDLVYLENISHNEERNLLLHLTATGHAVVATQEENSAKDTFLSFAESADSGFLEYLLSPDANGLFVHQRLNSDNPSRVEYDVLEITPDLIKSV